MILKLYGISPNLQSVSFPLFIRRCEGDNVITNGDCLGPCAEGFKVAAGSIEKGDEFDWKNSGTAIAGTAYAIKACLEDSGFKFIDFILFCNGLY
jgi:hypothetical protein